MEVVELPLGTGLLGLSPLPGGEGDLEGDLADLAEWGPRYVLTLNRADELTAAGVAALGDLIPEIGADWLAMPIPDMGIPDEAFEAEWPLAAQTIQTALDKGQRVLIHCKGGCGRTGMVALRLMVEAGEAPEAALQRLRAVRPCAVESDAQREWAEQGAA